MEDLLSKAKQYALANDLDVMWSDIKDRYRDEIDELTTYKERRLRLRFEEWITRNRTQKTQAG